MTSIAHGVLSDMGVRSGGGNVAEQMMGESVSSGGQLESIWSETARLPRLSGWGQFSQLLLQAARAVMISPFTTIVTALTVTLSLFLLGCFLLLFQATDGLLSSSQQDVMLSAYLKDDADPQAVEALRAELARDERLAEVTVTTKEQALEAFRKELGEQQYLLEGLGGENPLPASIEVQADSPDVAAEVFAGLATMLRAHPTVDQVQYSQGLLERLGRIVALLHMAGVIAILLLLALTAAIISNTIRLAVYARRTEIEIMRLVGATDSYVRTPFLIEGFLQGLVGGVVSLVLLVLTRDLLQSLIADVSLVGFEAPELGFISFGAQLLIILAGVAVGVLGSYLAVRRFSHV